MNTMDELLEKALELVEPGNYLIIEYYKGTQQETMEGDDYDDDNVYVAEETSNKELPMFACYGSNLAGVLRLYISKKENK